MIELGAELLELAAALVEDWLDEAVPPEQAVSAINDAAPRAVRDRSLRDMFFLQQNTKIAGLQASLIKKGLPKQK